MQRKIGDGRTDGRTDLSEADPTALGDACGGVLVHLRDVLLGRVETEAEDSLLLLRRPELHLALIDAAVELVDLAHLTGSFIA